MSDGRMKRFARKPKILEFNLDDGLVEKIKVSALKVKDFELVENMSDPDKMKETQKTIIKRVFEQNSIEWDEAAYPEMDWDVIDKILETVMNLNNIEISDAKLKFMEDIKTKQEQSRAAKEDPADGKSS